MNFIGKRLGKFSRSGRRNTYSAKGYLDPKTYHGQRDYLSPKKSNFKVYVLIYLFAVFLVGSILFIFVSDYFKIDNIIVLGNQNVNKEDIELALDDYLDSSKFIIFKNNNIFMFGSREAGNVIKEKIEMVRDVKITKKVPGRLRLIFLRENQN